MKSTSSYKLQLVWPNIIVLFLYHYLALQGLYYLITLKTKWATILLFYPLARASNIGITAGAHRLWCHKAYKATLPLRAILCFLQTLAFQNSIYEWCRDHRVHHKFADTDADPHNINRGFFFSHMGWLMVRKHPDVLRLGKTVNMSDLEADPIVRFQKKFYVVLAPVCCFVLPTIVPWYFWNENMYMSFCLFGMLRYVICLHGTWLVNSAAHMWGSKPYDRSIAASENRFVAHVTFGEGWHNYHHAFPWDYKTSELGTYSDNWTTAFIDLMAKIRWAYDLRMASPKLIQQRIEDTGAKTE